MFPRRRLRIGAARGWQPRLPLRGRDPSSPRLRRLLLLLLLLLLVCPLCPRVSRRHRRHGSRSGDDIGHIVVYYSAFFELPFVFLFPSAALVVVAQAAI
jgi:hypothetical protein